MTNEGEEREAGRDEANDGLVSSARSVGCLFQLTNPTLYPKPSEIYQMPTISRNGIDRAGSGCAYLKLGFDSDKKDPQIKKEKGVPKVLFVGRFQNTHL